MTETNRYQSDSPSESPSPPGITTSKASTNTSRTSADNESSSEQQSIDQSIMEQDEAEESEEHKDGDFDPNGHYQSGKFTIACLLPLSLSLS